MVKYAQLDRAGNVVNTVVLEPGLDEWEGMTLHPLSVTYEILDGDGNVTGTFVGSQGLTEFQGSTVRPIQTEPVQPGDVFDGAGFTRPPRQPTEAEQARARKRAAYGNLKGANTIADIRTAMLELFAELDDQETP